MNRGSTIIEINNGSHGNLKSHIYIYIYKTFACTRTQSFGSQAGYSQPSALPLKAGDSSARVNHVRGLELVQPQKLTHYFFLLLYLQNYCITDKTNINGVMKLSLLFYFCVFMVSCTSRYFNCFRKSDFFYCNCCGSETGFVQYIFYSKYMIIMSV